MENDRALRMEIINSYLNETRERFCYVNETYFDRRIPEIMLRISDRLCSRIGYAHSNPLGVVLSYRYLQKYGWDVMDEVLKHEIAHIYSYHFYGERGHLGPNFRNACRLMAGVPHSPHERAVRRAGEMVLPLPQMRAGIQHLPAVQQRGVLRLRETVGHDDADQGYP